MEKLQWTVKHKCDFNDEIDFLETILKSNGVEDIQAFLNVSAKNICNPFLMNNIEKGLELYHEHLGKKMFLKVDTDVDGLTSSAHFYGSTKKINPDTEFVVRTNYEKQHGLAAKDLDEIEEMGDISLIVIPDATFTDLEVVLGRLKTNKIPILILDHHDIDTTFLELPNVVLINCTDGNYPNPDLSGVGVVHKFFEAYCTKYNADYTIADDYLDLTALGIIADSMDLRSLESRYYALEGLEEENRKNELIKEIVLRHEDEMKLGHTITTYGWVIAPKLNAVIRYGKQEEVDNLFRAINGEHEDIEYQPRRKRAKDALPPVEIHSLQKTMARVADNVKARQDNEVRKFMKAIDEKIKNEHLDDNSVIIVDGTDILSKKTVTGLVASKIATNYRRPVVLLKSKTKDLFCGSIRGYEKGKVKNFNAFLTETGLITLKGHPNSAGVIDFPKESTTDLINACNEKLSIDDLVTIYEVDYEIKANNLTNNNVLEVANAYKIWGKGTPEPLFAISNLIIPASEIKSFGENNNFIRFAYNGVNFIKKYCSKNDFYDMTLVEDARHNFGKNKKILRMNILGTFVLEEDDEGNRYPKVKIMAYDSEEYIKTKQNEANTEFDDFEY